MYIYARASYTLYTSICCAYVLLVTAGTRLETKCNRFGHTFNYRLPQARNRNHAGHLQSLKGLQEQNAPLGTQAQDSPPQLSARGRSSVSAVFLASRHERPDMRKLLRQIGKHLAWQPDCTRYKIYVHLNLYHMFSTLTLYHPCWKRSHKSVYVFNPNILLSMLDEIAEICVIWFQP